MNATKSFNRAFPEEFILRMADESSHFLENYLKEIQAPEKLTDLAGQISWLNYLSRNECSPVTNRTDEIHFAIQHIIQDIYDLGGEINLSEDSIALKEENGMKVKPSLRIIELEKDQIGEKSIDQPSEV